MKKSEYTKYFREDGVTKKGCCGGYFNFSPYICVLFICEFYWNKFDHVSKQFIHHYHYSCVDFSKVLLFCYVTFDLLVTSLSVGSRFPRQSATGVVEER